MQARSRPTLLAAALALGACATGSAETPGDSLDATAPPADASSPVDTGTPDTGAVDASIPMDASIAGDAAVDAAPGCDAATPAVIPPSGTDNFLPNPNLHWAAAGNANINVTQSGWATLTADANSQAGAIWWNATYTFDAFDVTFTFQVQNKSGGADGLGFAWVPGSDVSKAGNAGGGYGLAGLNGWGVIIDTYQNDNEPSAPFLTVLDPTSTKLTKAVIPNIRDGASHTMRVVLKGQGLTVWIDGVSYLAALTLSTYTPFTGHWGFVAGTGSSSESHAVTGVSMTFTNGQGCTP